MAGANSLMAMQAASTILSTQGQMQQASAQQSALNYNARQLDIAAGQSRAESQRQAAEQRRQGDLRSSRALALAASSGAGAVDPTVLNIIAGLDEQGDYAARTALYQGEERAIGYEQQAASDRYSSDSIGSAAQAKALSTIINAGASMYGKYGSMPTDQPAIFNGVDVKRKLDVGSGVGVSNNIPEEGYGFGGNKVGVRATKGWGYK